ncbi:MAG TPA: phosphogluconate dehydratase [Solirubrobacteraceae bacterium]|jgi:phosphogluconate dehydratase|nr:phosphogluconate dehydratase [Solirubrobacteraceae bacterium]
MHNLPSPGTSREVHLQVAEVTDRINRRSRESRREYLDLIDRRIEQEQREGRPRRHAGCANLAHGVAACGAEEKDLLARQEVPNVAIVSAYNDMLSAHQPLERYPALLKKEILRAGGVAQFAGGVPAMCDGITQGRPGMELSLFSRDVVALATAVTLAHEMFDAALLLGVCDKIVPGLVIGALSFGHLPCIFVPGGPMPSGTPNAEKARVRELHAQGQADAAELLESELRSYHAPGTCTFYGTANTNQLVMEALGLHLPGASFVTSGTPLRRVLTEAAGRRIVELTDSERPAAIGRVVDERALVNGMVALLATGGSTNHTMHLVAMAAAAGISLTWKDFADLSAIVPLLARIYPNGSADINEFHAAGGTASLFRSLLDGGLLHEDVMTVAGQGLSRYSQEPNLGDGGLAWRQAPAAGAVDPAVLRSPEFPFADDGGIRVLEGSLGRGVIKVSAVSNDCRIVEAPARVFDDQQEFLEAFGRDEFVSDVVVVVRFQGPKANGMPELHRLTPALGVLQGRGHRVALVTDGRMSGASGKVPAAIHCTPEAANGGPLSRLCDGDIIRIDTRTSTFDVIGVDLDERPAAPAPHAGELGTGRELFRLFRNAVSSADTGATIFSALHAIDEQPDAVALARA